MIFGVKKKNFMEKTIDLTPEQISHIASRQSQIAVIEAEKNHNQEKLNSFVSGLLSAKGFIGGLTYTFAENKLIVTIPEETPPIEE